jgi:hypothetical protein
MNVCADGTRVMRSFDLGEAVNAEEQDDLDSRNACSRETELAVQGGRGPRVLSRSRRAQELDASCLRAAMASWHDV